MKWCISPTSTLGAGSAGNRSVLQDQVFRYLELRIRERVKHRRTSNTIEKSTISISALFQESLTEVEVSQIDSQFELF